MPLVKTCFLKCPLEKGVKVFGFPDAVTQIERRKKWFEILNINWKTPKYIFLCAKHFSREHFTPKNLLKITAVPDINLEMRATEETDSPCCATAESMQAEAPSTELPSVRPRLFSVLKDPDKIAAKQKTVIAYKIVKLQKPVVLNSSSKKKLIAALKGPTKPAIDVSDSLCSPTSVKPLELDNMKYVNSASKDAHLMLKNGKPYQRVSKRPLDSKPYKYTGKFVILKQPVEEDAYEIPKIPKTGPKTQNIPRKLKKTTTPAILQQEISSTITSGNVDSVASSSLSIVENSEPPVEVKTGPKTQNIPRKLKNTTTPAILQQEIPSPITSGNVDSVASFSLSIVENSEPPVEVKTNTQKALEFLESMMVISTAVQTDPILEDDQSPRKQQMLNAIDGLKRKLAEGEERLNELNKRKQEARKSIAEADKRIADIICAKLSKDLANRVKRSLKNNFQ